MGATYSPFDLGDAAALRALATDPGLAGEFDHFHGDGAIERELADPYLAPASRVLARADGAPAGFAYAYVLPAREGRWTAVRLGVATAHRRRGIGAALLARALAGVAAAAPDAREACISAWQPAPEAAAFAARHGFAPARTFWELERPRGEAPAPAWPDRIERATFDGADGTIAEWTHAYDRAFADHWRAIQASLESSRAIAARPGFRPDGLLLARRDGACVGFCRCEVRADAGEVAVLGVVPEARGIGLGRALLRWGVAFLEAQSPRRVTLNVDGANEGALALYRSEGFRVARERRIWSRPLA